MLCGYKIGASGCARCVWVGMECGALSAASISQHRVDTVCSMYMFIVKRDRRLHGNSSLLPDKTR